MIRGGEPQLEAAEVARLSRGTRSDEEEAQGTR
jgi:hypothetical protein